MSHTEKRINDILGQEVKNTDRRVLLVEGNEDVKIYIYKLLLERKFPSVRAKWVVSYTGGKKILMEMLAAKPDWLGLVDRDEWSEHTIQTKQQQFTNLLILPRFCLENYLVVPDELWETLPKTQQDKIGDFAKLREELLVAAEKWIRHGVLWSVINPLWEGMVALGFKGALLDFQNAQDDVIIRQKLNEWYGFLEPQAIFKEFQAGLQEVVAKDERERLTRWVHGKQFYQQHVHLVLNKFLGQKDANERKIEIFRTCPVPTDLDFVFQRMGLL
jgi:hypothetical protein